MEQQDIPSRIAQLKEVLERHDRELDDLGRGLLAALNEYQRALEEERLAEVRKQLTQRP